LNPTAIIIGGPTASGKSKLAFELSNKFPSLIINADSMQVYDDLKILTNRPTDREIRKFSCKLFGFVKYPEISSLGLWKKEVDKILEREEKKTPIFVGGTGLYLDSIVNEISPIPNIPEKIKKKVRKIHKNHGNDFFFEKLKNFGGNFSKNLRPTDKQRLIRAMEVKIFTGKSIFDWQQKKSKSRFSKIIYIVLNLERQSLYEKINKRCLEMIDKGVIKEVDGFLKSVDLNKDHPIYKSIGIRTFQKYINKDCKFDEAIDEFMKETRRYAKRQMTWFRNKAKDSSHLDYLDAKEFILRNLS